ncbi:TetR/AcrR family transcriptional regulator [Aliamphritea hakodatensis]|uniref:TetR/AcrR family transcriptional regulator n=1 Tax=Aliamphritea hakodatensis TaxID=2895352 RepID=UPI0022FD61F9|nr:TetR/AcrR family transcriptional regulator [Aliamphritea hakodatensis]
MPKIVDHQQRRDAIARAASKVIAHRGLEATKLTDIGKEAGVTTGAIRHYFEDKEAVLIAALEYAYTSSVERMLVQAEQQPYQFDRVLLQVLPSDAEGRGMVSAWLIFWGRSLTEPRLAEHQIGVHNRWIELVQQQLAIHCQQHGLELTEPPLDVAEALTAQINGLMIRTLIAPDDWSALRLHKLLSDYLRQSGLMP